MAVRKYKNRFESKFIFSAKSLFKWVIFASNFKNQLLLFNANWVRGDKLLSVGHDGIKLFDVKVFSARNKFKHFLTQSS